MYNKIFTKILDSSIWLEDMPTRIVWMTFLASMDEDGFACFASIKNLAHRSRVPEDLTEKAVNILESADPDSSDTDNEGRRVERVPGGWMILNATKYRDLVTRIESKEKTRQRVAKYRETKKQCNADVTLCNVLVTQSDTDTNHIQTHKQPQKPKESEGFEEFWKEYPRKIAKSNALRSWLKIKPDKSLTSKIIVAVKFQKSSIQWRKDDGQFIPHPATWLNGHRWEDQLPVDGILNKPKDLSRAEILKMRGEHE